VDLNKILVLHLWKTYFWNSYISSSYLIILYNNIYDCYYIDHGDVNNLVDIN
jgi:hypothetical protein